MTSAAANRQYVRDTVARHGWSEAVEMFARALLEVRTMDDYQGSTWTPVPDYTPADDDFDSYEYVADYLESEYQRELFMDATEDYQRHPETWQDADANPEG